MPGEDLRRIALEDAVGTALAHDITRVIPGSKGEAAFRRGHVVCSGDLCQLRSLGKEHLFVMDPGDDRLHEDDAGVILARALAGQGLATGSPREGKVVITATRPGLFRVSRGGLLAFNMHGDVACATLHDNTVVSAGQVVAHARAIPLLLGRDAVAQAEEICRRHAPVLSVKEIRRPDAGILITGNEVFTGLVKDGFAPVITARIRQYGGTVSGIRYAPDDRAVILAGLRDLLAGGADLLITTGGMSVDPDDVTRFAIRDLGAQDITYGSAVSPGAMFLSARVDSGDERGMVPILGVPACALHAPATVFDLVLPRILAGEEIGRKELAELGHGGLCMRCSSCHFPLCPFGR